MTYQVRRQFITGKLILGNDTSAGWVDCDDFPGSHLILVDAVELRDLMARIAKYERRAEGQRKANAARKVATPRPEQT